MSGHNKWSQIKHKKAKTDAKRGKAFTKLIKEITVVAREGGGDPAGNARLRQLIEKSKYINMPIDNITRAIKKGTGELPGAKYEASMYEGYGPYGIAVLVETLSDNKNRTIADMRHMFSKGGGTLGETGSVNWMFKKMGAISGSGPLSEDELLEALLDHDIADIKKNDGIFSVLCDPKAVDAVRKAMEVAGIKIESAEHEWVAQSSTELSDEQSEKVVTFLSTVEDHDDVQNVYTNLA